MSARETATLQADPTTAALVEDILGITCKESPGDRWSGIEMTVETNEFAAVTVSFIVSLDDALRIVGAMKRVPASPAF
jgi:hypothetical protein